MRAVPSYSKRICKLPPEGEDGGGMRPGAWGKMPIGNGPAEGKV